MLIKKELATVPAPEYPKGKDTHEFRATAQKVKFPRSGEILVVDFFRRSTQAFIFRFFSDGKNFISCHEWPAVTWRENCPSGIIGYATTGGSVEELQLANKFLNQRSCNLNDAVHSFCTEQRRETRYKAEDRRYELQKQHFSMFPPYPDNLQEYCEEHVFGYGYIFISAKDKKGNRDGFCSRCGKHFNAGPGARSGTMAICPKCGKAAVYRATWFKSNVENREKLCIATKVDGQLLIRWLDVYRTYEYPSFKCKYIFDDYAYNLHLKTPQGPKTYFYKWLPVAYGYTWYRGKIGDYCFDTSYIYTDNLDEVFGKSYYNVDIKAVLSRRDIKVPFAALLNNLKNNPAAEYLFKLNMPSLAAKADHIDVSDDAQKGFSGVLGVSKQLQQLYSTMDVSLAEHLVIKTYAKWVTPEELGAYRELGDLSKEIDTVSRVLQQMSFGRFVRYFKKQKERNPKNPIAKIVTQYRDYIDMSVGLGVDLSHKLTRFPFNCMEAHDQILPRYNQVKHEAEDRLFVESVKPLYANLSITEYEKNGFCIVLPRLRSDLITEGQSLNHCVGGPGYFERHIAGTRMIFFVRRIDRPEKPFFTLEVDMSNFRICQLYGFGNTSAPKEVRRFAEDFTKKLSMPAGANRRAS